MSTASTIIHSVRLISSGLDHSDAFVAFEDGRVLATGTSSGWRELAGNDTEVLDGVGHVLTPGLLDIHNHGGAGASYGDDGDAIRTAMRLHRQHGTTRQLLSLVTASPDVLISQIHVAAAATWRDPTILGIHLEGPFLSSKYCGRTIPLYFATPIPTWSSGCSMPPTALCARSRWRRSEFTSSSPRGSCGRQASSWRPGTRPRRSNRPGQRSTRGRHCSLTPSMRWLVCITVRPTVLAFVDNPGVWLEVINDGVHVRPEVVRMLCRLAPGRVAFVSDAMAAAGAGDGRYRLGNLDVQVAEGVARLTRGNSIAGSTLTLDVAIARAVRNVGLTPLLAIEAATVIPAQILGVEDRFGRLEPGYVADAVLFDSDWRVRGVWIDGQRVGEQGR